MAQDYTIIHLIYAYSINTNNHPNGVTVGDVERG